MPGVLINWKDEKAYPRLIAALVATTDAKIDYNKIASVFGQGATYNSIEGRFRIIKKEALELKAALENKSTTHTPAITNTTTTTAATVTAAKKKEKGKKDGVIGGRVTKVGAGGGRGKGAGKGAGKGGKGGVVSAVENEGMAEEEEDGADGHLIKEEI